MKIRMYLDSLYWSGKIALYVYYQYSERTKGPAVEAEAVFDAERLRRTEQKKRKTECFAQKLTDYL